MFTETTLEAPMGSEEGAKLSFSDRNRIQLEVMNALGVKTDHLHPNEAADWIAQNGKIMSDVISTNESFKTAIAENRWEDAKNILIEKIKESQIH